MLIAQEAKTMTLNRIITRVASRARIVAGRVHPDDVAALAVLGCVAGYETRIDALAALPQPTPNDLAELAELRRLVN